MKLLYFRNPVLKGSVISEPTEQDVFTSRSKGYVVGFYLVGPNMQHDVS